VKSSPKELDKCRKQMTLKFGGKTITSLSKWLRQHTTAITEMTDNFRSILNYLLYIMLKYLKEMVF
jgi:hypothetical protein